MSKWEAGGGRIRCLIAMQQSILESDTHSIRESRARSTVAVEIGTNGCLYT